MPDEIQGMSRMTPYDPADYANVLANVRAPMERADLADQKRAVGIHHTSEGWNAHD
jgi:hypothetical protein